MNFDDVRRASSGSLDPGIQAASGSVGQILAAPGVWTALGASGYQLRSDVSADVEWAVAAGWPMPDRTTVAARLQVPGPSEAFRQYAEPLVVLDSPPRSGEVIAHHVTTYPADEAGHPDRVNHIMIRAAVDDA